jgi:hypothetical protein
MDENIKDPEEKSRIEQLIHMSWFPEWHLSKIKNSIHNFNNLDYYIHNILDIHNYDIEFEDQIRDLLIIEMIASSMLLAETFASLVNALLKQPDNIQYSLKKFARVPTFYKNIDKLTNDEYLKILSIPPNYQIDIDKNEVTVNLSVDLEKFKEILTEIKNFYFKNNDLFNSYKHGFRIFSFFTLDEIGKSTSTIMYFSQDHRQNEAVVLNLSDNPDEYLKIAILISATFRILHNNLKNKLKNPREWKVSFPAKTAKSNG